MNIVGTITQVMPLQSGTSKAGNAWQKQEYILTTLGQYPKTICFSVMGDNIGKFNIRQGQTLSVEIDISSREYNGRWFTSVNAWKVSPRSGQDAATAAQETQPASSSDPFYNSYPQYHQQ